MSELFPQLSRSADDLCVIRSMHTDVPNHEPGLLLMHSGKPATHPTIVRLVGVLRAREREREPADLRRAFAGAPGHRPLPMVEQLPSG